MSFGRLKWGKSFTLRVIVVGLMPVVVLVGLVGLQARSDAHAQEVQRATSKARAAGAALEQLFTEWRSELLLAANNRTLTEWYTEPSLRAQRHVDVDAVLVSLNRLYPDLIDEGCFIDAKGPELARQVLGKPAGAADLSPDESGNPFFAPTFALNAGLVHQHTPYVSPDSGRWVISNSTPIEVGGTKVALLHFETSLQGVRTRLARIVGKDARLRIVDDKSRVIIDTGSKRPIEHASFVTIARAGKFSGVMGSAAVAGGAENANHWKVIVAVPQPGLFAGGRLVQLGLALLFAIAALIFFAKRISRGLTGPVRALTATADSIAAGDLTQRTEVPHGDEVGVMAEAINRAATELDLAIGGIATETMTLAAAAEELDAVSANTAAAADGSSQAANRIADEVRSVRGTLDKLEGSCSAMSSSMEVILERSRTASVVAESAETTAQDANGAVGRLDESSREIGEVVKLIDDIAAQTNLLALNATIEAARAGESGRGFAVVASEVKNLAQSTGDATAGIAERIEKIRTDTHEVVGAIEQMSRVLAQVRETQQAIENAAGDQADAADSVSRDTDAAGVAIGTIETVLDSVVTAVRETAEGANQNRSVASELSEMAARLSMLTGRFEHTRQTEGS